jgi:hypothetical protein
VQRFRNRKETIELYLPAYSYEADNFVVGFETAIRETVKIKNCHQQSRSSTFR